MRGKYPKYGNYLHINKFLTFPIKILSVFFLIWHMDFSPLYRKQSKWLREDKKIS